MQDIKDADYMHVKKVLKNFGEYHDLYLKSDTLFLLDVFENASSWITMASRFKKTEVKLELLTDIDMLLMIEKGIRGGICHVIHQYTKANKKYMKDYDKNKESSYLKYRDVNYLYVGQCRKSFQQIFPSELKILLILMKIS